MLFSVVKKNLCVVLVGEETKKRSINSLSTSHNKENINQNLIEETFDNKFKNCKCYFIKSNTYCPICSENNKSKNFQNWYDF